ncbi:MAG: hypothetical protein KatS3mg087_1092 [Patescibacteria group bacterium]|nr:MAG: hypothetical protein KatS3mg087_1092 [Patescibacteria group bacterium]
MTITKADVIRAIRIAMKLFRNWDWPETFWCPYHGYVQLEGAIDTHYCCEIVEMEAHDFVQYCEEQANAARDDAKQAILSILKKDWSRAKYFLERAHEKQQEVSLYYDYYRALQMLNAMLEQKEIVNDKSSNCRDH